MSTLNSVVQDLDSILEPARYTDYSLNGLQVEYRPNHPIRTIAVAVDAGESVLEAAIAAQADLLIVHHGLFWGQQQAVVGPFRRKIALLLQGGCSLYAAHLPLDGNIEVGNAAELARLFSFEQIEPAFQFKGMPIGITCTTPSSCTFESILEQAAALPGFQNPLSLLFGAKTPSRIGIATGSAASVLPECAALGLDTLITGEPKQEAYHVAKELGLNALFLGHYATETTGVRALAKRIEADLDLTTTFLDEPTGI
jgi:dinuclear metal center YbgI/SA1388 family protein